VAPFQLSDLIKSKPYIMVLDEVKTKNLQQQLQNYLVQKNDFITDKFKNLYLLTVNHKTAPVAIREKFAIPEYNLTDATQKLKTYKSLKSFLILSTCNRTEIYFKADDLDAALDDLYNFFNSYINLEQKVAKEYSTFFKEIDVVHHAFRVGSGLESLVMGESQVLSQVKAAYSISQKEATLGDTLETLFQFVIKSAKEVHKNTNLSKNCQSISSAAIDLANKISGSLSTKQIMVLGAGKMAELALEHILKVGGAKETVVLNRSPHRIIEFADKYKTDRSIPFENVYEAMNDVDIVIAATGAPHFIIFADEFNKKRKDVNQELLIIDISMPRNIDSEIGNLENVKLMDIDSLQLIYNEKDLSEERELEQAQNIISEGIATLIEEQSKELVNLLIKDLKEKFDKVRTEKLSQVISGKTTFTVEELDYITKNIINAILHKPIKNLKDSNLLGSQSEKIELLKDLFEL